MSLTITQASADAAIEGKLDKPVIIGQDVAVSSTTTAADWIKITGYDASIGGALSTAVPASGHILANRSGSHWAIIRVSGSFTRTSGGVSVTTQGHIYVGGSDTGYGFDRDISASGYGSFAATAIAEITSTGTQIDLRINDNSAVAHDYTFSHLSLSLEWIN